MELEASLYFHCKFKNLGLKSFPKKKLSFNLCSTVINVKFKNKNGIEIAKTTTFIESNERKLTHLLLARGLLVSWIIILLVSRALGLLWRRNSHVSELLLLAYLFSPKSLFTSCWDKIKSLLSCLLGKA